MRELVAVALLVCAVAPAGAQSKTSDAGHFFLGFNAILNWNDLDAGKAAEASTPTQQ